MGNYTVTVDVKDGGILKQLESLQKNGIGAAMDRAGGGGGGGSYSFMNKLQDLGQNQLVKLAGISIGVGSLVALTVKSSGILQSSLKLLETSFMLVFKPFGDFIGLAFRPLALMMLGWAIPFYKWAGPLFRDYATKIGEFFNDPALALAGVITGIGGAVAIALATKFPNLGGGVGGAPYNCGGAGGHSGGCIRLCDTPTPRIPTPTGIPTGFPIPVPLMNPGPSLFESWNKKPKHSTVDIMEQLSIGEGASTPVLGAKQEWGLVETASAAAAASAMAAALLWDDAVKALSSAVARISSMAGSIPNSTTIGMQHFGSQSIMAANGATGIAAIADTLE